LQDTADEQSTRQHSHKHHHSPKRADEASTTAPPLSQAPNKISLEQLNLPLFRPISRSSALPAEQGLQQQTDSPTEQRRSSPKEQLKTNAANPYPPSEHTYPPSERERASPKEHLKMNVNSSYPPTENRRSSPKEHLKMNLNSSYPPMPTERVRTQAGFYTSSEDQLYQARLAQELAQERMHRTYPRASHEHRIFPSGYNTPPITADLGVQRPFHDSSPERQCAGHMRNLSPNRGQGGIRIIAPPVLSPYEMMKNSLPDQRIEDILGQRMPAYIEQSLVGHRAQQASPPILELPKMPPIRNPPFELLRSTSPADLPVTNPRSPSPERKRRQAGKMSRRNDANAHNNLTPTASTIQESNQEEEASVSMPGIAGRITNLEGVVHGAKGRPPKARSPKAGGSRAGSPRAGSPRAGNPRAGSPTSPGSPRAGSPKSPGSPRSPGSPTPGSPRPGSPRVSSPRYGSMAGTGSGLFDCGPDSFILNHLYPSPAGPKEDGANYDYEAPMADIQSTSSPRPHSPKGSRPHSPKGSIGSGAKVKKGSRMRGKSRSASKKPRSKVF
jgi:hypothetical protein